MSGGPTVAQIEAIVERASRAAAREAIQETFRLFGVDITDQKSVNEFHSTIVHAQRWRKIVEKIGGRFVFAAILGFIAYAFVVAFDYVKAFFAPFLRP